MKVHEKGTDRTAHVHVYVQGRVNPLQEYGQYVDAGDGAVCCYVPVEEGDVIKLDGRFNGLTLGVAYDCIVDGVYRKVNSFVGKSVQVLKNRKLDVETLLCQTSDGVIDTKMSVTPYPGTSNLSKEISETIGTIELHVYIHRQFDVEHVIDNASMYDRVTEDLDSSTRVATYKDMPPPFQMTFEKNCLSLDGAKVKRENKKFLAKRPGTRPWAIFRFHYRTKASIETSKMELTFEATDGNPAKQDAHLFELEAVPPLVIGSKPAGRGDGESSVRTSSPSPPDTPSTPTKASKKAFSSQPKAIIKKQGANSQTSATRSASGMAPTADTDAAAGTEAPVMPKDLFGNLQSTSIQTKDEPPTSHTALVDFDKVADDVDFTPRRDDSGASTSSTPKKMTKKAAKKATGDADVDLTKPSKDLFKKLAREVDGDDSANVVSSKRTVEVPTTPTIPHPTDVPSIFEVPTTTIPSAAQTFVFPGSKDFVKSSNRGFTSPVKKAAAKPVPIDTATSTILQKPSVLPKPPAPIKRAPEGTLSPPPDVKRIKTDAVPILVPAQPPRNLIASPSPRVPTIEAQVAEQRKRLEAAREKRAEVARKKAAIEQKLAPYKQRMAEELERLRQEMADEEALTAADEEDYMASEAMLAEFENGAVGM